MRLQSQAGKWNTSITRRGRLSLAAFPPARYTRYARFAIDSYLIGVDLPSAAAAEAPGSPDFLFMTHVTCRTTWQGLGELSTPDAFFSAPRKRTAAHEGKGEASVCSAGSISTQNLTSTAGGVIDSQEVFRYLPTIIHRRADDCPVVNGGWRPGIGREIQRVNRVNANERESRGAGKKKEGKKNGKNERFFFPCSRSCNAAAAVSDALPP